jgi:hypothetical protein
METVDSFELEMEIFSLLDGCFQIQGNNGIQVLELPQKLQHALVTHLPHRHLDTPQIEHHLAEQPFFDDKHDFRLRRGVDYYFLEQSQRVQTDVSLCLSRSTS